MTEPTPHPPARRSRPVCRVRHLTGPRRRVVRMGVEAVALIGRNGMGKTTLCNTIMGLVRATSGEIDFDGERVRPGARRRSQGRCLVCAAGPSAVPSLTVDEHLTMLAKGRAASAGRSTGSTRCSPGSPSDGATAAAQLSGGEQQMLAVGRALLLNGSLVIMDEPSEGLAPTIVDTLIDVVHRLVAEGSPCSSSNRISAPRCEWPIGNWSWCPAGSKPKPPPPN